MNKTLRIVAKDARHLWPEILVSLAITAGFVATDHFNWPQYSNNAFHEAGTLRTWMQILMPITWWLLVSRAVHDESLVGDRQFWITRPYGWPRVLAAKLIFIATFILFPYLLAQIILLQEAHLHPLQVLPGLGFTLAAIFLLFLLPLFALATITSTISRIFIIFFGLIVYAGVAAYFSSLFFTTAGWVPGSSPRYIEGSILIAIIIAIAATLVQYSLRRTRLAILLLLTAVAVLTAGSVATTIGRHHIDDYPHLTAGEPAPLTIALDPHPRHTFPPRTYAQIQAETPQPNEMPLEIPIFVSGIAPNHAALIDAVTMTVSADGHPSLTIPWGSQQRGFLFDGPQFGPSSPLLGESHEAASIPRWIYRQFADKQITLHLTYAVTELEAESPTNVPFNARTADVPDHGSCFEAPNSLMKNTGIACEYALTTPSLTHVTWNLHESCNPTAGASISRQEWIGDTNNRWRDVQLSPVVTLMSGFATNAGQLNDPRVYDLCPGTAFTFTKYHILRRRMIEVTLPPIDPTLYIPLPTRQPFALGAPLERPDTE